MRGALHRQNWQFVPVLSIRHPDRHLGVHFALICRIPRGRAYVPCVDKPWKDLGLIATLAPVLVGRKGRLPKIRQGGRAS